MAEGSPVFVAFEGGDAAGKTTQTRRLADHLDGLATREPGSTGLGEALRAVLLDRRSSIGPRAEALLMLADRAQHVAEVIRPALERGQSVVTDRFSGSTLAYQGFGRGLPIDELRELCDWAADGLEPDLVVVLDVPPGVAARRLGEEHDRFEAAGDEFHARVRAGFRALAGADPERWVVLEAEGSVDEVAEKVRRAVAERLGR